MDFEANYNFLLNQMNIKEGKSFQFNLNQKTLLLPFSSRKEIVYFKNGFKSILGEFSRIISNKDLDESLENSKIIENIISGELIEFDNPRSEDYFKILMDDYLEGDENKLKISNPLLLLYSDKNSDNFEQKGEEQIALFFRDVFFQDDDLITKFKKFLYEYESNDTIVNLILDNFPKLPDAKTNSKYIPVLNNIVDLFKDDLIFLIDNYPENLLENMDLLFAYYYFLYSTQLMIKIKKDFVADYSIEELYYILDWESVSKKRTTINRGYGLIEKANEELLSQMYLIDQLNILIGSDGGLILSEIDKEFESFSDDEKEEFLKYLEMWVNKYHEVRDIENKDYEYKLAGALSEGDSPYLCKLKKLTNSLYCGISNREKGEKNYKGVPDGRRTRYAQNINLIGSRYFMKSRGLYGFVLNLNRDLFLFITALCVREKKINVKKLFEEYEKRGLFFDKYSKKEIINYLNRLNLIDKKSDSGDAQYVRPIL